MRRAVRVLTVSMAMLLLLFSVASCRNRDYSPRELPADGENGKGVSADFQCWVCAEDGTAYPLSVDAAVPLFESVSKAFQKSDSIESFPDTEGKLMLIFCVGGTAPESVIPAYQLPNARHYGVYTLFPDDTGRYSSTLLTANVRSFKLKKGSYERITGMAAQES